MDMAFNPWNREIAISDSEGLEPLGWSTLTAKLSATHRLRRELVTSAHPRCGTASFAPLAFNPGPAHELPVSAQSNHDVNPEPLGDGKARHDMSCGTGEDHSSSDGRTRGMQ